MAEACLNQVYAHTLNKVPILNMAQAEMNTVKHKLQCLGAT